MTQNKNVYISIGRHGRYGYDTAIERQDMLRAYIMGKNLKNILPTCETIYHSPLPRAIETARFNALGLNCNHILQIEALNENTPKYEIKKFFNKLIEHTDNSIEYYHFITHLPVIEKLGLPFLAAGDVCLLCAQNWTDMLCENFSVQIINAPEIPYDIWKKSKLSPYLLEKMSTEEIYNKIADLQ